MKDSTLTPEPRRLVMETRVSTPNALNANQERKMGFRKRAKIVKLLREQGGWLGRSHHTGRNPLFHRARIDVYLSWSTNRRRDTANWAPMAKAMTDGFTDARLFPDDNTKHVEGPFLHPSGRSGRPGVLEVQFVLTELAESQ